MTNERVIADALGVVFGRGFRVRLYRELTEGVAPGLDETTYPVLSSVARSGGPIGAQGVAEEVGTDRSVVSRRANALVEAGLVRTVRGDDGRSVQFELTDAGSDAVEQLRSRLDRAIAAHLAAWTDHDRAEFARLFQSFSSRPLSGD